MQFSPLNGHDVRPQRRTRDTDGYPAQRTRPPARYEREEPRAQAARRDYEPAYDEYEEEEDYQPTRREIQRYQEPRRSRPQPRRQPVYEPEYEEEEYRAVRPRRRALHSLFYLGIGALATVASSAGTYKAVTSQPRYEYGVTPTAWTEAVVNHNNDSAASPSVFMSVNYKGRIIVTEFPAGDMSKALVYEFGSVSDASIPVTLTFTNDAKPAIQVHVGSNVNTFNNDGSKFLPMKTTSPNLNQ